MLPATVVLASSLLLAPSTVRAGASPPPASGLASCEALTLPPSIHLQNGLEPIVRWALEYSPTFPAQCRALAAEPSLTATVRVAAHRAGGPVRARAIVHHPPSGAVEAHIEISCPSELIE